jgi:hypothetical protein
MHDVANFNAPHVTELFGVEMTPQAEDDLERLFEFLVIRSTTLEEVDHAEHVLHQLRTSKKTGWPRILGRTGKRETAGVQRAVS